MPIKLDGAAAKLGTSLYACRVICLNSLGMHLNLTLAAEAHAFFSDCSMERDYASVIFNARSIAIIGAKDKPNQPVDKVGRYLLDNGYIVYPVHPVRKTVWGLAAYEKLADVPGPVDIVNVFRAPQHCPLHAQETLALPVRPQLFWMQLGIVSPEAGRLLAGSGILVVEDACLMVVRENLRTPFSL